MQLLTTGAQDQYITVSPEMSYFKQIYKRPTNFSMQSVQTTFSSTPGLSTSSRVQYTCRIPRVGDLLKDVFLSITLPDIYVQNNLKITNGLPIGQPQFRWIPKIGNYIIYSYSLTADTQLVDQRWGEYDDAWVDLTMTGDKKPTYNRMIGNVSSFETPISANSVIILKNNRLTYSEYPYSINASTPSIPGRTLYIPLNFWFSKSPDLAIPLVALQYQTLSITIEMRMLDELYQVYDPINNIYVSPAQYRTMYSSMLNISDYLQFGGGGANTVDLTPYLECNYVFLDTPERTYIATNSFDLLIENVYRTETSGIQNVYTIDLPISNPIKEIIWITRRSDIFNYNDWANLTAAIPEDQTKPALATAKIIWNGIDRFDIKDSRYFNLLQPYEYHTASPREGIYVYSFSLYPEQTAPSGSFNASVINKTQLYVTVNPFAMTNIASVADASNTEYHIIVYSMYYNVFRVMSGAGAMVFAN